MALADPFLATLTEAFRGGHNWDSDALKVALINDAVAPDKVAHDTWADLSANEITGTGYTAGGTTLTTVSVVQNNTAQQMELHADNATWSGATFTARYAVVYNDTHLSDALISFVDFESNQSPVGETFAVQWGEGGLVVKWPLATV